MALINIDNVLQTSIRSLKSCKVGTGVELMSYKRNRWVAIICLENDFFQIKEKGYLDQEDVINQTELTRFLKKAIKREFPRSRKVRLFKFANLAELEREHQKI